MMSARLICRVSRLLLPAVARLGGTVCSGCRGRRLGALAGVRTSSQGCLTDGAPERPWGPERTAIDERVEAASSVEELLLLSTGHGLSANYAAVLLLNIGRLSALRRSDPHLIITDTRFQNLLRAMDSQISMVWNGNLVGMLRSLLSLGLDTRNRFLRSVENEVRWRLRRLSFRTLVTLAEFYPRHAHTQEQRALLAELLKHVELRWTEITEPRSVVSLMVKLGHLSPTLMDRLEDKGLELAEGFTVEDMRKLAVTMAVQGRRSVPLLRALSYHFMQKHQELRTGLLLDMAFAYGKLNFQQTQVFQRLTAELLPRVPELSPTEVVNCAKSFAYLKWLSLPLFEALAQYTLDNCERMTMVQLSNIILAFARLNYQPTASEVFFTKVHEKLSGSLGELEPFLLTDLVCALCVLHQVTDPYLSHVLAPSFTHSITEGSSAQKVQNYKLKLCHINTTARLECGDYTGPLLMEPGLRAARSGKPSALASSLHEELQTAFGPKDRIRVCVDTAYGWHIDGELVVSSENQPLPLQEFVAPHLPQSAGTKPLPPGARRLAFMAWEFPNFVSRSKDPLGRFAMARRHLVSAGFLVVDVPYYEWLDLKSGWQRVAYLKDKMGKTISEELAK
ncbi:FAST kinase domain-containing protein 4 precursor [Callorhinchus milii]|uniref:FAST kinase domain-containing protein 4 n=1 Tax=Callorhinchus milii TaxID=7868 RepID=K4FYH8_CALMI|nr:FAST kinase domain-containing protein 4 precursor [Callorhinchus milii]AFK11327.1 protein TBRG4 [Callorhinchus milii]